MSVSRYRSLFLRGGVLLWLVCVGAGLWWFTADSFVPGKSGAPAAEWPADSRLTLNPDGCTLILALHPECPCSQATVEELGRILARTQGRLKACLLMVQYEDIPGRAEDSPLWKSAARLPGVSLVADLRGEESRRFAARTSGETRLYDSHGRLLFRGGITASRGHAGDNPGESAVCALALKPGVPAPITSSPVFGCAL